VLKSFYYIIRDFHYIEGPPDKGRKAMINIVVCDSSKEEGKKLCSLLEIILEKMSVERRITPLGSKNELLKHFSSGRVRADILFLTLELKDADGISLSRQLYEKYPDMQIILVTGDISMAREICSASYKSFLVKPITADSLSAVLELCVRDAARLRSTYITVTSNSRILTINTNEIKYCESDKRILFLHTVSGKSKTYLRIGDAQEMLPRSFVRIHKSYLVNFDYVSSIFPYSVRLYDGTVLPIPQKKYKKIKQEYMEYVSEKC